MKKNIMISLQGEAEHALLKRDAHRHEMTVSEYIRWLVEKQRKEDKQK